MSETRNRKILCINEIKWENYKLYYTKKNDFSIYRCKSCYKSKIKKKKNIIYNLSGHAPNCKFKRNSTLLTSQNSKKSVILDDKLSNSSKNENIINDNYNQYFEINIFDSNKSKIEDIKKLKSEKQSSKADFPKSNYISLENKCETRNRKILSINEIKWENYKLYYTKKNDFSIYRCKSCYKSKIKKKKNIIYNLSGHAPNCKFKRNSTLLTSQNSKKSVILDDKLSNSSKNENIINDNYNQYFEINIFDSNKLKIEDIINFNIPRADLKNDSDKTSIQIFQLLMNVFDKRNNLNKQQELMGLYYVNKYKKIGDGSYTNVYLGEDKFHRINVAVLELDLEDWDTFEVESFILERIHAKGNFPQLYHSYMDEEHIYLVENFMGPNLQFLFSICNKKFDYFTVINIAIDLIKNIKILHNLGYIHRDLKPDNLVFGNLCLENYDKRKEIGIIDFGNSKININSSGKFKHIKKKVKCKGNRCFSSTKALKEKDVGFKDDIISIFYILIYFLKGKLPWQIKNSRGEKLSKAEIIEIRENCSLNELCLNIPIEFINLTKNVFNMPDNDNIDYNYILRQLEIIKKKEELKENNKREKFCWLEIFKKYNENSLDIGKNEKENIKYMLELYSIKLNEYLEYIYS